jgi:hypothetical protein
VTWLGITVYVLLWLVLWPFFVKLGQRHGRERTYVSDRFAAGVAAATAATPASVFVLPVSRIFVVALVSMGSITFWLYATR